MRFTLRSGAVLAKFAANALMLSACTPRLQPLQGAVPVNNVLPSMQLPAGPRKVIFTWELHQNSIVARGEGAARIASPDSARVDLFLVGGFGGAAAILIGDSLRFPSGARLAGMQDMVPSAPLIWASLGRLALPALADTIIRISGDTSRADIGHPVQWRLTAAGNRLIRLEHVSDGKIVESVQRDPDGLVRYESSSRLSVVLHVKSDQPTAVFDDSIWHF